MAVQDSNLFFNCTPSQQQRQQQLFCLISQLCVPRFARPESDVCRLIVDSLLQWAFEPIDGESSWLYLPEAAHAQKLAGCLVLSAR